MDPRYWRIGDTLDREHFRRRNGIGRAFVTLVDDTGAAQLVQFEGYAGELRDGMQRLGEFGFHSMPLPGASLVTVHHGGDRGFNTTIGVEDGRYRPRGGKPGESGLYAVDAAKADGSGGTFWWAVRALAGRIGQLLGKVINIGDAGTQTITITASQQITLIAPVIVLSGTIKLGGEGASTPASMRGTVDSNGDTDVSGFATKVLME